LLKSIIYNLFFSSRLNKTTWLIFKILKYRFKFVFTVLFFNIF
jgi:hypothetical protein